MSRVLIVRALKSSYVNSGLVSFVPVRKSELSPSYHCKLSKADAIKTGKLGLIFLSSLGIIKPPQTSSPRTASNGPAINPRFIKRIVNENNTSARSNLRYKTNFVSTKGPTEQNKFSKKQNHTLVSK